MVAMYDISQLLPEDVIGWLGATQVSHYNHDDYGSWVNLLTELGYTTQVYYCKFYYIFSEMSPDNVFGWLYTA